MNFPIHTHTRIHRVRVHRRRMHAAAFLVLKSVSSYMQWRSYRDDCCAAMHPTDSLTQATRRVSAEGGTPYALQVQSPTIILLVI